MNPDEKKIAPLDRRFNYEGCPDGAFSPDDLEVILEICTDLYCFGYRSPLKMQAIMNRGLTEGLFDRLAGRQPDYLPHPSDGFSYEFVKWAFERVRLRIGRRMPKTPEEYLKEDFETMRQLEAGVLQQILRNQTARGNAGIHLSAVSTYLQLVERRHKMLGLDATTLIVQTKAADTVVGKILKDIMERHPASRASSKLYDGAPAPVDPVMEIDDPEAQALALLNERNYDDGKPNDEPKPDEPAGEQPAPTEPATEPASGEGTSGEEPPASDPVPSSP